MRKFLRARIVVVLALPLLLSGQCTIHYSSGGHRSGDPDELVAEPSDTGPFALVDYELLRTRPRPLGVEIRRLRAPRLAGPPPPGPSHPLGVAAGVLKANGELLVGRPAPDFVLIHATPTEVGTRVLLVTSPGSSPVTFTFARNGTLLAIDALSVGTWE